MAGQYKNLSTPIVNPLTHATTYSGADTRVFIYRDLVAAKEKAEEGKRNAKDGTVTSSESSSSRTDKSSLNLSTSEGYPSMGQYDSATGTFKNKTPTNRTDQDYRNEGSRSQLSGSTIGSKSSENFFNGQGLDSIISELGSLHSINYSTFREKAAVRTLGRSHARAYTRGQRTVAGTMVFTVLQSHELLRFANRDKDKNYTMLDQIDPFNLLLLFSNEYGSMSALHLFNVDINTESQGMSIDAILLNNTMNFYAQDMLPMEDIGNVFETTNQMLNAAFTLSSDKINRIAKSLENKGTGLATITSALKGESRSDQDIRKLLQRSRGLF